MRDCACMKASDTFPPTDKQAVRNKGKSIGFAFVVRVESSDLPICQELRVPTSRGYLKAPALAKRLYRRSP
jgi:hypothetical protein